MDTPENSAAAKTPAKTHERDCVIAHADALEAWARKVAAGEDVPPPERVCVCSDAEPAPPSAPPQQTGPASVVDVAPEHVGKFCFICGDEPNTAPIEAGDQVVVVPTDQGELLQHPLCFYVQWSAQLGRALAVTAKRAEAAEERAARADATLIATHQTLCSVLAKTGRVTYWPHNFERAAKAGWKIDTVKGPDDSTVIGLRGSSIELAQSMPKSDG